MHKNHDSIKSPANKPPLPTKDAAKHEKMTANELLSEIFASLWKFILLFLLCGFIFVGTCIPAGISTGLDNADTEAPFWCAVIAVVLSLLAALWLFRKSPIRLVLLAILLGMGIVFVAFVANSF